MRVAITGANSGFGLSMAQVWARHGHVVDNFSRSNGHDIKESDQLVSAVKDYDMFINNAYSSDAGFAQTELLYNLFNCWQGQKKFIINISTEQTNRWLQHTDNGVTALPWQQGQRRHNYRTTKVALEDAQQFLSQQNDWPKMIMVKPAIMNTPRTQGFVPLDNDCRLKMNPDRVAEWLYLTWSCHEDFFVNEIAVRPLDWYSAVEH
jgi:hypothetical protein